MVLTVFLFFLFTKLEYFERGTSILGEALDHQELLWKKERDKEYSGGGERKEGLRRVVEAFF